jgi:cellulose synthase/poly-beta-1,6-N-acetylglucosamine synthase-like glycosyltransferase
MRPALGNNASYGSDGLHHRGRIFLTYSGLKAAETALVTLTRGQITVLAGTIGALAALYVINWHQALTFTVCAVTLLYCADLLFNFYLIYRSFFLRTTTGVNEQELHERTAWPRFTILCPLYQERAVLPQFIRAMQRLDYPPGSLEILLLLEEDDIETIDNVAHMALPYTFHVLVVPHGQPKTKPKACNYGLRHAAGEYVVIYDAEDIPDRDQLKKAVLTFEQMDSSVFCLQAKLNYYNTRQNIITRLFTLEYSLWFDLVLTGLQSVDAPIPLGGTSNHFRTHQLRSLDGWDPFNVTEDAELGMRLAKHGYRTAILDSTTMEEANSRPLNWLRQRSRWIKGYMQTYLVHNRGFGSWRGSRSWIDRYVFELVVGGKTLSMLVNPLLWLLTLAYFVFRPMAGPFIETLFPPAVYYLGLFALVIGNFLYLYYYMMGAAKREQWDLVRFAVFVPVYWLAMSVAAYVAAWEVVVRPHYWHKTKHGLHLGADGRHDEVEALMS